MILVKTPAGLQVLKDRSVPLTPAQRMAFILFDGKRSVTDVLKSTGGAGATRADIDHLCALGLLAEEIPAEAVEPVEPVSTRTPQERYAAAYPIATRLTAGLGLRGVRLNLAVEGARSYEDLLAVAGKIRDAVGPEKYAPLGQALEG